MAKKGEKKGLTNRQINEALIQNFINLQKVMTNLSIKFDSLSDQMSRLLQLFEISAKTFVVKQEELTSSKDDQELVKKLDVLMDQNKTIAKGLTLVEEKIRHRIYGDLPTSSPVNSPQERIQAKPLPRQIPKF
jgi:hypothetical protein